MRKSTRELYIHTQGGRKGGTASFNVYETILKYLTPALKSILFCGHPYTTSSALIAKLDIMNKLKLVYDKHKPG